MYNNTNKQRTVILPTNDLNFKRLFASPELIHISKGFLQDLASYDPLASFSICSLTIETPYNFQEANRLNASTFHRQNLLNTEVDYACMDKNGLRFMIEMQKKGHDYLEERILYNAGQKFAQKYAGNDRSSTNKYSSLRPVISVIILEDSYFKDDIPIRFLRPHDARFDVYKKNLNLGLEIYVELNKDTSKLPENLKLWIEYFRTGSTTKEAPRYLQEAVKMTEITQLTKEERELADLIEKLEQKRIAEDETIQRIAREKGQQEGREEAQAMIESKVAEEKRETAKKLFEMNLTVKQIVEATGLSEIELEKLK